jgi:hypothetical protein
MRIVLSVVVVIPFRLKPEFSKMKEAGTRNDFLALQWHSHRKRCGSEFLLDQNAV